MKITDAIALIEPGFRSKAASETWADLGSGSGTFTKALAAILGSGGKIYAVDKQHQIFKQVAGVAFIEFYKLDFVNDPFPFFGLDGILMANALHFVNDKRTFIEKLKQHLQPAGRVLIVEYDTEKANPWIPHPISFDKLADTFPTFGFSRIEKIGERDSIFRREKMYACMVETR